MSIRIEENQVQSVRCATCKDLVAYTSDLIRVLDGSEKNNFRRVLLLRRPFVIFSLQTGSLKPA